MKQITETFDLTSNQCQLDEGVKDVLSGFVNFFKKTKVEQLRTKLMINGESRIFASEDGKGKVNVVRYESKKKAEEKNFSSIQQAEDYLKEFEEKGYKTINTPSGIKKAITWIGSTFGWTVSIFSAIDIAIAGVFAAGVLMGIVPAASIALVGVGVKVAVETVFLAGGWALIKVSKDSRQKMNKNREVINLQEKKNSLSPKAEEWVKKNKERFKKQYGDDWESILYATAHKLQNNGDL